jgi:glutamate formiminotransferase/formiminotetrahydrofolate cyclodeaminase
MGRIIECVPNVSEGRDKAVISKLASSIVSVKGVKLLHTDIGKSANRTVFTFAGPPEMVVESAFELIKTSSLFIDMSRHSGTHPRIGAVDVCPLVPISGISMEETIVFADILARKVGNDLDLPVYLYANSAVKSHMAHLENIRRGEYESLNEKIKNEEWIPDYGPVDFIPHFGAVVIGARDFLIAFNVNLGTENVEIAKNIAAEIRESGRIVKVKKNGHIIDGRVPGLLKKVKAIGWYEERYRCAQVSVNIVDYHISSIEKVFDTIAQLAVKYGVGVTGSEIIGLVPLRSILKDYTLKEASFLDEIVLAEIKKIEKKLKLHFWGENELKEKIIEYKILDCWSDASVNF